MPKSSLSKDEVKAMLLQVADRIIEAEPMLSEADRNLGDGDHGLGMARGMNAVKEKLAGEVESIEKAFTNTGMAMMSSMGGASGAIFGTLWRNGGKALAGRDTFDAQGLADLIKAGLEGVMTRGGAKPGDKTMIDALHPASVKAQEVASQPLNEAITAVAAAAEAGREASKAMIATMGRAKTLGEQSIGHPDAGACSVVVIFDTMRDYICA
ncbi:MAG: putative kinase [Verrucomicrobiaceae bacterium]|nr:putative kinase [Verrucomicrobiaceae bacterium]